MAKHSQLEEAYKNHARMVYGFLLAQTGDPDTAEELTQETFYQAVKSSGRFDESCKISTWLCAITKNVLLAYRKKQHGSPRPFADTELPPASETDSSAEESALGKIRRMELMQRLHALPDPMREVLYLRLLGDLSFREIGEILGHTENWARVTFYRGKEKLKEEKEESK